MEWRGVHWYMPFIWATFSPKVIQCFSWPAGLDFQVVWGVIHYLDDFLIVGLPSSSTFWQNLNLLTQICKYLGVPLVIEKVEGPSTVLPFLGILLDTTRMEARLPEEKLTQEVSQWINCTNVRKREILSPYNMPQKWSNIAGHLYPGCMQQLLS